MKKFPLLDLTSPELTPERASEILYAVWFSLIDFKEQKTSYVLGVTASAACLVDDRIFNLLITNFSKRIKRLSPEKFLSFFEIQSSVRSFTVVELTLFKLALLGSKGKAGNPSTRHDAFLVSLSAPKRSLSHIFNSIKLSSLSKGIGKVRGLQREFTRFFLDVLLPSPDTVDQAMAAQLKLLLSYSGLTGLKLSHKFCDSDRSRVWMLDAVCKQSEVVDKAWAILQEFGDDAPYARMLGHNHPSWNMSGYPDIVFCAKQQLCQHKLLSGSQHPTMTSEEQLLVRMGHLLYEDEDELLLPENWPKCVHALEPWKYTFSQNARNKLAREADKKLEVTPAVLARLEKMGRNPAKPRDPAEVESISEFFTHIRSFLNRPVSSQEKAPDVLMTEPLVSSSAAQNNGNQVSPSEIQNKHSMTLLIDSFAELASAPVPGSLTNSIVSSLAENK